MQETMSEPVIPEAIHADHAQPLRSSSSSSGSDEDEQKHILPEKFRLFGRRKPIHSAVGGGKHADIILWRNKQISASMLAGGTVIWLLFEWIGYHLLTFICHSLILTFAATFFWSNLSSLFHKSPLNFSELALSEEPFVTFALLLRNHINQAFVLFQEIASGKDLKKFVYAILALWVLSIVGSWFEFLTLLYIIFVLILTLPLFYEMREDQVDAYAEKAAYEIKKRYTLLDEKVL